MPRIDVNIQSISLTLVVTFFRMLKMRHYFSVFTHKHISLNIFLFLAILSLIFPIVSTAGSETNAGDELISLIKKLNR